MAIQDIKERDVVELLDDNELYFVRAVDEQGIQITNSRNQSCWIYAERVINVWRHVVINNCI